MNDKEFYASLPSFPNDDSVPSNMRGKPIGYVDHNNPKYIPQPLDVGTVRTDGIGGSEGYNVSDYSPLFRQPKKTAPIVPAHTETPKHTPAFSAVDFIQSDLIKEDITLVNE